MESFGNFEGVGILGNFGNFQFRLIFNILWDCLHKNQQNWTFSALYSNTLVLHYFFDSSLTETPYWFKKFFLSFTVNLICDTFQQNREQVTQVYFEIWTIEVGIGVKNNSFVDIEIFIILHTLKFSNILLQDILHFLQPVIENYRNRKLKRPVKRLISQNHTSRETAHSLIHK